MMMTTTRHTLSALALLEGDTGGQQQQRQGQQQDESTARSPAPGSVLDIEGSSPGSLSPHHREEDTAPHEDNDGADGTGVSFGILMAAIDREHDFDLSAEPQEHRQEQHQHQQANQGQDQEGEEKEDEGGAVRTTAAPAAAAAHPVEPTKAILGATAVAEAIERAITVTKKTQQDTEDAVSTFCDTMARNQAKVVDSWKGVASAAHTAVVQLAAEKSSLIARNDAQTNDLQCILRAAVGEKDALSRKLEKADSLTKRLQAEKETLKEQRDDLQCILVAAVAEKDALTEKLEDATMMTTDMIVKPPPAAATTTATVSPSRRPPTLAFLASCAAAAKRMSPAPAIAPPPDAAATTAAAAAAPIASSPPATITAVTDAPATPTISAPPIAPSATATITTAHAITAVSTPVPSNDENRGGKVSGCPTGGRSPWVGVGVGGARFSTPRATAAASRSPLSVIRVNTPARKITTCVVTPGFASLTRGTKSSMAAAKSVVSAYEGGDNIRTFDGEQPGRAPRGARGTKSTTAAGKRGAPAHRGSEGGRPADGERAQGMARRLRSAGRPRENDTKNTASVRGQKVSSGAGVSSRTRQATSRNKAAGAGAAGGGKVVRKRWM